MSKVNLEKKMKLSKLTTGDKIKLTTGEECEFVRLKRTRFIGIVDGKGYDIHVNSFDEVIEEVDQNVDEKIQDLEKGDLFYYISNSGDPMLLKFDGMKDEDIIKGINPISKGTIRLPVRMYGGKVDELK